MKTNMKRLLALILALSMVMSLLSVNVWAADTSADGSEDPAVSSTEPQEEPQEETQEETAPEPEEEEEEAQEEEPPEAEPEAEGEESEEEAKEAEEAEEAETAPEEEQAQTQKQLLPGKSLTVSAAPSTVATRITSQDLTNYTGYGNLPGLTTLKMSETDTVSDLPKTGEVWLVFSADGYTAKYVNGVAQTIFSLKWSSLANQINNMGRQVYYSKAAPHPHSFTYSASGATITATCGAAGCDLPEVDGKHVATLTVSAPTTGNDATITVSPEGALTGYTVKYQTKSGSTWGAETSTAPSSAGIHKATVTLGGVTASVSYGNNCITYATGLTNGSISGSAGATCGATVTPTITPAEGYQLDTLTVTSAEGSGVTSVEMTADGKGFVMPEANVTVSATFKRITYTVEVDGGKATVTDSLPEQNTWTAELTNVPADKTYDGETVDLTTAAVQKSDGFPDNKVAVGTVSFKDQNNNTVTTAKSVGTYTASATVGDKTISKVYTIHGRTPSITYVESIERVGNNYLITKVTTDQYIPLENNPNGITLLKDGETYVASGNIAIGALVYTGEVNLILCENTTVTIYAGIYHIGSKLNIYTEEGAESSELIVKGNKALSALDHYADFNGQTILDENAALSGTIQVYGGKLTVEKGNSNLVSDDISLTLAAGLSASGMTHDAENADGSVTYEKAAFASLTSLAVKPVAEVTTAPTAKTLTYTGSAQELVTAGEVSGGTMHYALGTDATTAPAEADYKDDIPTATNAGTYYVWYKVKGDESHNDSKAACVKVTIAAKPHEHTWGDWEVTKKATCVAKGEKKRTCSECKKEETAEIAIDPNNHTGRTEIKGKKDATESADGYTGDTYCKDCGKKLKSGKAIPKLTPETVSYKDLSKAEKQSADAVSKALGVNKDTAAKMVTETKRLGVSMDTVKLSGSALAKANVDSSDPKGSSFGALSARAVKRTKHALTLRWRKQKNADGYLVYGNLCGKGKKLKLVKTITKNGTVRFTQKKLKKGKYYKYMVVAYKNVNGEKMPIAASVVIHVPTKGGKTTVAKGVKVTNAKTKKLVSALSVKKGQSLQLKAVEVKAEKKLKVKAHRKVKFESSDRAIVAVNAKGRITGRKKGKATVYAYAQNGICKAIRVTVK